MNETYKKKRFRVVFWAVSCKTSMESWKLSCLGKPHRSGNRLSMQGNFSWKLAKLQVAAMLIPDFEKNYFSVIFIHAHFE